MAYSQFGRRDLYYPHHDFNRPARQSVAGGWKIIALVTILLLSFWSGTVTFYLVYRDDALMYLAHRQTEMVQGYDAQLTALETEIERLKSLKLVDQERVDRAVLDLGRRQALVEQRQKELANIAAAKGSARAWPGEDVTGTIAPSGPLPPSPPGAIPKPSPISDTIIFMPPPDRSAALESRPWFAVGGIGVTTLPDVVEAGAIRIVVVRAITDSPDPSAAVRRLIEILPPNP